MSAWLVRIVPDQRRPEVRKDLVDMVRMHRRIMSLVPEGLGDQARRQAGVLFRVEDGPAGPQILAQTRTKPLVGEVPEAYGRVDVRELTPLLDRLGNGTVAHYRLAANASKRLSRSAGPREGHVVALRGAEAERWWADRAPRYGLVPQTLTAHSQPDATGERHDTRRIRHAITRFDGIATITDADLLREAILTGIGRGKPYGCGLLSIAPLQGRP